MNRLSINDMKALAKLYDGKCLSEKYTDSHTKLIWRCSFGHHWEATPTNIKQGKWCPRCAGRHKTIEDMATLARQYGGVCLSTVYRTAKSKLNWQCRNGHIWEARPDNIEHGNWCPICALRHSAAKRLGNIEEMRGFAELRGGKCLSMEYLGNNHNLRWECDKGHTWHATPGNIKSGKWCPLCGGRSRLTIEEMRSLSAANGGKCLSEKYVNRKTKLEWKCEHGHVWEAMPDSIKSGKWCPVCAVKRRADSSRDSIETMRAIAEQRGGKCISGIYNGNHRKLTWECAERHTWEAVPGSIKSGTWCPECSSGLGERISRAYMEQLFEERFPKARPKWLKSPEGNQLELDGFCAKLHLAFEHQGAQHFERVARFHTREKEFERGQMLDDCKRQLCNEHNVRLIEILEVPRYIAITQLREYIKQECLHLKVLLPSNFDTSVIDLREAYCLNSQSKLSVLQEMATGREGKLLSDTYFGERSKLKWACQQGHVWEAAPYVIRRGSWCKKCASAAIADRQRGDIEECMSIAKGWGGQCLSTEYVNVITKLRWQCDKGHIWEAVPNNIRNGQWCPICVVERRAAAQRDTIAEMRRIAEDRGGSCISEKYINSITKLHWQCSEGHIWEARPGNIKFGQWCPICARRKQ
jgi:hypothetical protein